MVFAKLAGAATMCGLLLAAVCAPNARAALVYENVGGTDLIHDTLTGTTWTRDADISGQLFTYQGANAWAAGLTIAGLTWELPTTAQFTSLYTELYPYGAPGAPGADHKYGANVLFGGGPNDSALNVQTVYWTQTSQVDFNFFYGYAGGSLNSTPYAAWAVEAPEPASFLLLLASLMGIGLRGKIRARKN